MNNFMIFNDIPESGKEETNSCQWLKWGSTNSKIE